MVPGHEQCRRGCALGTRGLAVIGAAALLVVLAGTVLATRAPRDSANTPLLAASQEPEPDALSNAADRLAASGITVDDAVLADLASRFGVGGAVRVVAWSHESGLTVEELAAMREGDGTAGSEMGWGRMAKELGVHPGIGSIMGNGGGNGRDGAPGQEKKSDEAEPGD